MKEPGVDGQGGAQQETRVPVAPAATAGPAHERFGVTIANTGETFLCSTQSHLLKAMEQLRRKGIPVGCRNGGCGVCKVHVTQGRYEKQKMSRAVISEEEEARDVVLACRTYPRTDMTVEVVGKMVRAVVRDSASFSFSFGTAAQLNQQEKED